jgi:hypothetical protein
MRPILLSTLRSLANAILGKTGKRDRFDTATRMAMDADFIRHIQVNWICAGVQKPVQ